MIQIKLTEELENQYDIFYKIHLSNIGWLDWASNDQITGTFGYHERIEAIQIQLIKKGEKAPENTKRIYIEKPLTIQYYTHVQNYGWMKKVNNGEISGTVGKSKRVEALIIEKSMTKLSGDIYYRSYVEGEGWQDYVSSGNISGTSGKSKKIEMIQIKLTEELENKYNIYYRVHVSNIGWLDWASNDQITGTFGYRERIEAIQIELVDKEKKVTKNNNRIYLENKVSIKYQSYLNGKWQESAKDGATSGSTGKSTPIRAYRISVNDNILNDWIQYRSYISGKGWQNYVTSNEISGNFNSDNVIEMIQMKLSPEASKLYNVYYRVHVSNIGWLDWASNDQITGTLGYDERIEAFEIKLLSKEDSSIEVGENIFREKNNYLTYSTHVQDYGWLNDVYSSNISGKPGSNKRMEAIKIQLNNTNTTGEIKYSAHSQDYGWLPWVKNGEIGGTVGKKKRMEAIKIELTDNLKELYDVYYKAYVEGFGWLDWAKNGEIAGSISISKKMEGIQIILVEKGGEAPGKTDESYVNSLFKTIDGNTYYFENGNKVTGFKTISNVKYFFNSNGVLIADNVKKIIDVSNHQSTIDWSSVKSDGVDGAIIRLGYGTSYTTDACVMDNSFEKNYNGTKALGLLSGIYLYSYAIDKTSATIEANFVLEKLKKYNVSKSIPIYYDLEENAWTKSLYSNNYHTIIESFSNILEKNGYSVKIYTYKYWAENRLDTYAKNKLDWIAQYSDICTYNGSYKGWQFTDNGKVLGINGAVDISVWKK